MPVDKKFAEEALKAHNEYRSRHQASKLKLSSDLNEYAQRWAEHLVATDKFEHSDCMLKGDRLGENVGMKWSSGPMSYTGQDATDQWYSEVKDHTFGCEPSSLKSGHFTQVVWKGSEKMGIGKAENGKGKTIVVASYSPAGNMMGQFATNVLPPKDGKILLPVDKSKMASSSPSGGASGGTETKTTRTYTTTEGSGPNAVTKTVVEETIIGADGSKKTTRKETVTTGGSSGGFGSKEADGVGKLSLDDKKSKNKSRKDSSSSDSSPESSKKKPMKMKDFIDEAVNEHNRLRAKHGAGKLKHDKDLTAHAQKWAEQLASTDSFKHSQCVLNGDKIGENICCKWSSAGADYTGKDACEQWYSEISKHDFSREPSSLGSGHFTQMVWKASTHMGIGKAKTSGGKCIVVANYKPAGNFVGRFVENVAPLKK